MAWRPVIYLNLVRSIRTVINALAEPDDKGDTDRLSRQSSYSSFGSAHKDEKASDIPLPELIQRLRPLATVETILSGRLVAGEEENLANNSLEWSDDEITLRPTSRGRRSLFRFQASMPNAMEEKIEDTDFDDQGDVIYQLRNEIISLWRDPTVQAVLKSKRIRLQDCSG